MSKFSKKWISSIFLAVVILAGAVLSPIHAYASVQPLQQPQLKVGVISDTHYYPLEYTGGLNEAYQEYVKGNMRLLGESGPALDSAIEMILADAPDVLLVTGDITNDGEYLGAVQVAEKLEILKDNGIKVYVINGNHDINSPGAVSFASGARESVAGISASDFRSIFSDYGYNGEDHAVYYQPLDTADENAVQGSLSYVVTPKEGFKLIMVDTFVYTDDYLGTADAMISNDLLDWILAQIELANQNGEVVVMGMHHALLSHYTGEAAFTLDGSQTVHNWPIVAERLANAGLKYVFSGHIHSNDIAELTTRRGNKLIDMSTGSLASYGAPVRTALISKDDITVQSRSVPSIDWQGEPIDYQAHIRNEIYNDNFIVDIARKQLVSSLLGDIQEMNIAGLVSELVGLNIMPFARDAVIEAFADGPIVEETNISIVGDVRITLTYHDTATPYIRVTTNLNWLAKQLLPDFSISLDNNIMAAIEDVLNQIDTRLFAVQSDGTTQLEKDLIAAIEEVANKVVYTDPDGAVKTLNDFVVETIMAHQIGGESAPEWVLAVIDDLQLDLTRSIFSDILVPAVKSTLNTTLDEVHLKINTLIPSSGSWRMAVATALTGSDNRTPSINLLLAEQDVDVNGEIDELVAEYVDNDSYVGMVGQPLSLIAAGVWTDTPGVDDWVNGPAVSYHIEDATDAEADVEFSDISLGVGAYESKMRVTWYSTSTEPGVVQIAKKADKPLNADFPENPAYYQEFAADNYVTNIYYKFGNKAIITGLEENTQYLYRLGNEGQWSEVYPYVTNEFDGNFNVIVSGDPQIGSSGNIHNDIAAWGSSLNLATNKFPHSSFMLTLGDQVDTSNNEAQYEGFLDHDPLRSLKISTLVGNHDRGSHAYSQHFSNPNVNNDSGRSGTGPEAGNYWYSFNNALFLVLNANNSNMAEHHAFLEEVIGAQGAAADWIIVAFHQSIYSVANHSENPALIQFRNSISPVLSALDVDLVLMGHDHVYTRTYMMNGIVPQDVELGVQSSVTDPKAGDVLYVTLDSPASKHYSIRDREFPYAAVTNQENLDNISNLEITDNYLRITTYRTELADQVPVTVDEMTVVDEFTIYRTGIEVVDRTAPILVTPGYSVVEAGDEFDPLTGVTAVDETDGDLTSQITYAGEVDTAIPGEHRIIYSVADSAGNSISVVRYVRVTGELLTNALIEIEHGSIVQGGAEEVSLKVELKNIEDLAGVRTKIVYNADLLQLKKVEVSPELAEAYAVNDTVAGEIVLSAVRATGITADAVELATLSFQPAAGFVGTTPLIVDSVEAVDSAEAYVAFSSENGSVTVEAPVPTYQVTVAPLTGGTIVANPTVAQAGTIINLIVTADEGMSLVEGSLQYSDGINSYAISGSSFVLPAANVTVTAEFAGIAPTVTDVSFTGETVVGQVLEAQYSYQSEYPEQGTSFRWLSASHGDSQYVPISGATDSVFTVTGEYAGLDIVVEVTPANAYGTGTAVIGSNGNNQVVKLGDLNNDGRVTFVDALRLLQTVTSEAGISELDSKSRVVADTNRDGSVNVLDVIVILQADLGLVELN